MSDDKDDKNTNVIQMFEELVAAEHPDGKELSELIFTNDVKNPGLPRLFHFIYDAVFNNKVGVMHALNAETKMVETLIVGVDYDEEGNLMCLPIAKVLTDEQQGFYHAPDGYGNWIGYED